jgi:hypothetical protein
MSFTVVPLHNLDLRLSSPIAFGAGFVLTAMPEWAKEDSYILNRLNSHEREWVLADKHAFVAEYKASAIGERDPAETGVNQQSIQDSKSEAAILANLALWLVQPSTTCFTTLFHALSSTIPGQPESLPTILLTETRQPLFCHPDDTDKRMSISQAETAGKLHCILVSVPRKNAVWTALRSIWGALTMSSEDLRYSLFWVGLEALLGPDGSGEIVYKLSQRVALLLSKSAEEAKQNFRTAKDCYNTRSKIVHGRWNGDPKMLLHMANTEAISRNILLRVLNDPALLKGFLSKERDKFLEEMIFAGYTK